MDYFTLHQEREDSTHRLEAVLVGSPHDDGIRLRILARFQHCFGNRYRYYPDFPTDVGGAHQRHIQASEGDRA